MMECTEVRSQLARYLDDDLPPPMRQRVGDHLEHCYLCTEELDELSALLETCRDALRFPNPRNRFEFVRSDLQAQRPVWAPRRHTVRYAIASLAAAAVILVFASMIVPFCETAWNLTRLAERVTDPNFAETSEAGRLETAAESNKRPLLTLIAWSCQVQRDDPLASLSIPQQRSGPRLSSESAVETTPGHVWKPLSMEIRVHPGMFLVARSTVGVHETVSAEG